MDTLESINARLERNKAACRTILEAFNTGDTSLVDKVVHKEVTEHGSHPFYTYPGSDWERLKHDITVTRGYFPDAVFTENQVIAEGDKVFLHWTMKGHHLGSMYGQPPSGRQVTMDGYEVCEVDDHGLILGHYDGAAYSRLHMMAEIGWISGPLLRALGYTAAPESEGTPHQA